MLSKKAKYALKALISLGKVYPDNTLNISTIAKEENIPHKFLEMILLELKNDGYLQSKSGRSGGYWMIKHPSKIKMGDIIRLFDGPLAPVRCASLTAYKPCNDCKDVNGCLIRVLMKEVRDVMAGVLDKRTLHDLINSGKT